MTGSAATMKRAVALQPRNASPAISHS